MHQKINWQSKDNLNIFGQLWQPEDPQAVICMVHGIGEHSGRYAHAAEFYNKNNIAFFALDHRGHGQSEGKRGHTPSYAMLMYDMHKFLERKESLYGDLPCFMYGHSLGGNIVSNFILAEQPKKVAGAILSAPYFKLGFEPPASKVSLARFMNKLYGAYSDKTGLDANHISKDKAVVNHYKEDPLVHDKMTARMFVDTYDAGNWALNNAEKLSIPALVMHAAEDKLTSPDASKTFVEKAGDLATFKIWEDCYHEVHNEPCQQEVFNFTLAWVEQVLKVEV